MDTVPTLRCLLPRYERHLRSMCYADQTSRHYLHEARVFTEFLWRRHRIWPGTVRARDLEAWQKLLADSDRQSLATVVARMRRLRAFFAYLSEANVIEYDPFLGFSLPRLPNSLPRDVLTVRETSRLLESPDLSDTTGRGEQLILELLYVTGLRVSELCGLDVGDVDLSSRVIHVRCGKGGKDRVVPMGKKTAAKIQSHVAERAVRVLPGPNENRSLFVSVRGRRLTPGAVQLLLRRETRKCAIRKHVTPHTLRHTCATHMHSGGAGIMHIKQILGHADVTTTQIYTRIAPREARETHRDKHPRERYARCLLARHIPLPSATLAPPCTVADKAAPERRKPSAKRKPKPRPAAYGMINGSLNTQTRRWLEAYKEHLVC